MHGAATFPASSRTISPMRLRILAAPGRAVRAAPSPGRGAPIPPKMTLPRISSPITIDGDLSDPGWADAAVIETFYEFQPGDNTVPPVKTIARVGRDDKYFYASFWCEEPDVEKIRAPYRRSRRHHRPAGLRRHPPRRGQCAPRRGGFLDQPARHPDRLDPERVALWRGQRARLVLAVGRQDRHGLVDGRGRDPARRPCATRTRTRRTGR